MYAMTQQPLQICAHLSLAARVGSWVQPLAAQLGDAPKAAWSLAGDHHMKVDWEASFEQTAGCTPGAADQAQETQKR